MRIASPHEAAELTDTILSTFCSCLLGLLEAATGNAAALLPAAAESSRCGLCHSVPALRRIKFIRQGDETHQARRQLLATCHGLPLGEDVLHANNHPSSESTRRRLVSTRENAAQSPHGFLLVQPRCLLQNVAKKLLMRLMAAHGGKIRQVAPQCLGQVAYIHG